MTRFSIKVGGMIPFALCLVVVNPLYTFAHWLARIIIQH